MTSKDDGVSSLTLLAMPDDGKRVLLEFMDLKSILTLRKTCHHLRNFIDITEFEHIDEISLNYTKDSMNLDIYYKTEHFRLEYQTIPKGCLVVSETSKIIIESQCYLNIFYRDFEILMNLKSKKPFDRFGLCLRVPDTSGFMDKLTNLFFTQKTKFRVKKVSLDTTNQSEIAQILPFFETPEHLIISYSTREPLSERIMNSEQFKNAERLNSDGFRLSMMDRILHCENVEVWCEEDRIGYEEMEVVQEKFLQSPTLSSLCIWLHHDLSPNDFEQLGPKFLTKYSHDYGTTKRWFYRILDSIDNFHKVLCLETNENLVRLLYVDEECDFSE